MSIDYCLICDECGKVIDGSKISPAKVRETAKREGTAARRGNRDLCFGCFGLWHLKKSREIRRNER